MANSTNTETASRVQQATIIYECGSRAH